MSTDNSERSFYKELVKVIEASDVILEVLDARDPLGTRCVDMERMVMKSGVDKHLVLLLNKIGNLSLSLSPHGLIDIKGVFSYFCHDCGVAQTIFSKKTVCRA